MEINETFDDATMFAILFGEEMPVESDEEE